MYRLPKIAENSETGETAPLLPDVTCLTDSDLYGCSDASDSETQKVVQALFSAWMQFPPRRSGDPEGENEEFLGPRAMDAMSLAWREIVAEREVLPDSTVIVQGLAESMVEYMYPLHLREPEGEEDIIKEAFTAHVTGIVTKSWQQILQDIEDQDAQEKARARKERRKRMRERMRRREEVAEILQFYEPFAAMDNNPPWDCRVLCIVLCQCCSIFLFQFPLHTLLLSWPLSIGIMGAMNMKQCPMSPLLPYVMMAMGVSGTVALLMRLSFAFYEKCSGETLGRTWPWTIVKIFEFAFLECLVFQLYYFFSKIPSFNPSSAEYCNQTFHNFVRWINYVSMALVAAWTFVYVIKGILWLRRHERRVTSSY